ncbi:hypothetical protein K435DRAFT_797246 [Dendrothele bispora CBS 962.96]|uniref:Uncharacterized protein n=1 Tax=Dendrothele bispora (strain CBS 962.96) TaxID=1314807 RepID=A0A4S8M356_DENBC|nr:hypothetical protein K435DRAFT_797246 [Dendrothele bispora CBS 962.96]
MDLEYPTSTIPTPTSFLRMEPATSMGNVAGLDLARTLNAISLNGVIRGQRADMRTLALAGIRLVRGHPGRVGDVVHQYLGITGGNLASLSLIIDHGSQPKIRDSFHWAILSFNALCTKLDHVEIRDSFRQAILSFNALCTKLDHVTNASCAITGSFCENDPVMSLMQRHVQLDVPTLERALIGRPCTRLEGASIPTLAQPVILVGSVVTSTGDVVNVPEVPEVNPRKRSLAKVNDLPTKPGSNKRQHRK